MAILNIGDVNRAFREAFPDANEGGYRQWLEEGFDVSTDHLGPRVTGGPYVPDLSEKPVKPRGVVGGRDKITIDHDARNFIGYTIFLGKEDKAFFLPIDEIKKDIGALDALMLDNDPKRFLEEYRGAMLVTARKRLREGTAKTPEEYEAYQSERQYGESWMTEEQVEVLRSLAEESA